MEIIPLITLKEKGILEEPFSISEKNSENNKLYVLDLDGVEKDTPNLSIFQRLSRYYDLWVDSGPRNLGDVVDIVTAGATCIILRENLFPLFDLPRVKEVVEVEIYLNIEMIKQKTDADEGFYQKMDGFVCLHGRGEIEDDFKLQSVLKQLIFKNKKTYVYEDKLSNQGYWSKFGVSGLLVNINSFKEFAKT